MVNRGNFTLYRDVEMCAQKCGWAKQRTKTHITTELYYNLSEPPVL